MADIKKSVDIPVPTASPEQQRRLLRRATYASVATAALLIAAKFLGWAATGSVSLLASLIDSLMDGAASLVNLFAVRYSLQPADTDHRFGHGKSEAIAALAQATFITGSAIYLLFNAVTRLLAPEPLQELGIGVAVMVLAIAATLVLNAIQRHAIRHTGSTAIRADALHYTTDLMTNLGVIIALGLAAIGWHGADPLFAMAIGAYILWSAWGIAGDAFHVLMDRELPPEIGDRIRELALAHTGVRGVHDLRTRRSGLTNIIQLHVELDPALPLRDAHAIADGVEKAIAEAYPGADVIIHQDPAE